MREQYNIEDNISEKDKILKIVNDSTFRELVENEKMSVFAIYSDDNELNFSEVSEPTLFQFVHRDKLIYDENSAERNIREDLKALVYVNFTNKDGSPINIDGREFSSKFVDDAIKDYATYLQSNTPTYVLMINNEGKSIEIMQVSPEGNPIEITVLKKDSDISLEEQLEASSLKL